MARAATHIDVNAMSDLPSLVEEIRRTDAPRVLTCGDAEVAVILPLPSGEPSDTRRTRKRRSGVVGPEDSLLNIIGMLEEPDPEGATDVSANTRKYLADAYTPKRL